MNNGNVGIGTSTPAYKLDVSGTFRASTSTFSGNVGIGTVNPSEKLEVNGKIKANNVLGVWIGNTVSSYDGNRGGYNAADALCASNYAGSHVCTSAEFTFSRSITSSGWYNTFTCSYNNNQAAYNNPCDCSGWQTNSTNNSASYWYTAGNRVDFQQCNIAQPFACCK